MSAAATAPAADRFRMATPKQDGLGVWYVAVRRGGSRPAGGVASGPTPERARAGAMQIVRDILQHEQPREHNR